MLHDELVRRGLRERCEIDLVMRFRPADPALAARRRGLLEGLFAERGIGWHARREVCALDPSRGTAKLRDGGEMPFDLFLAVPVHRAPDVVLESGMTVDGWIPVNPLTLETRYDGVYAVGDVAAVGTPRAGVFAEGQAAVAADRIAARIRGSAARASTAAAASATWRWATARSRASTSPSSAISAWASSWVRPSPTGPTRPSLARAGSSAGSEGSGRRSKRLGRALSAAARAPERPCHPAALSGGTRSASPLLPRRSL